MLRSLFGKLTGRAPDPTLAWPVCFPETPAVDLHRAAVGPLQFGDPIQNAQVFGRPDSFRWIQTGCCQLRYTRAGFQIDFEAGRLAYAAFFLAGDGPGLADEGRTLRLDGRTLTGRTLLSAVSEMWGRADSEDRDDEEIVACYRRGGLTVELEATVDGRLKRVNVFPWRRGALRRAPDRGRAGRGPRESAQGRAATAAVRASARKASTVSGRLAHEFMRR